MSIAKRLWAAANARPIIAKSGSGGTFGKANFSLFFDRINVANALDEKEWLILSGTGAYTRGILKRSIKKGRKKKPQGSSPGEPPRYHARGFGQSLKDGFRFEANLDAGGVVIGPGFVSTPNTRSNKASGAQLLEEGGIATTTIWSEGEARLERGRWRARPYIEPAMEPSQVRFYALTANPYLMRSGKYGKRTT